MNQTHPRALCAAWLGLNVLLAGAMGCHSHEHPHEIGAAHGASVSHGGEAQGDQHGHHDETEHNDTHAHGHEHGVDAIGITLWTEKLELFAEHPPAVTGQEITFLAHLTLLDGFKALENATVTLVLDGSTRVEARVTEKLRSGIFRPTLQAPAPGTYRGSLHVTGPEVNDTLAGFDVVVHASAEAAKQAAEGNDEGNPGSIRFLKEQQWQVPFGTAFASQGVVVPTIEVAGEVTTPPSGQAEVGAAIAGRVVVPPAGGMRQWRGCAPGCRNP
ncbi:MAG: hypothetical protein ACO3JL_09060 [Myxococcota bacterium]